MKAATRNDFQQTRSLCLPKWETVCDVYDAITSDPHYKNGWDPSESLRKMAEWSKGHFDLGVFQAFVKCIGIYPVGFLVRPHSGRLGVVMEQPASSLLTPKAKVYYSTKSNYPRKGNSSTKTTKITK